MRIVIRILFILASSSLVNVLIAQERQYIPSNKPSFEYIDGLYTNINMVIKNNPIPPIWVETDISTEDRDFFGRVTKARRIVFFDHNGVRSSIATDSIWGYCQNGDLYINIYKDFHKIDYAGRISHFIARKSTYIDFEINGSHPRYIHYMNLEVIARNTGYLVDLYEDKVMVFDVANLERVLEDDPALLNEPAGGLPDR